MSIKEYGGYIELESFQGELLHNAAIALNSGRNALAYLCEAKQIKKLYLPFFLCSSISKICEKLGVNYEYYYIDENLRPNFLKSLNTGEYLYIVNFYGQLDNACLHQMNEKFGNVIIDQAQSYFQMPIDGVDTLYTCRKYFGVPDGAFLYTDLRIKREIPVDESYERMHFLLGRYERNANEFYDEYVKNNMMIASEPIKQMSRLTRNLLKGIEYQNIGERRRDNFTYLDGYFKGINELHVVAPFGAFMYPLLIKNGRTIRRKLHNEKIYIPTLWPDVFDICKENTLEYRLAADILPIPVDQRYNETDMEYLAGVIGKYI